MLELEVSIIIPKTNSTIIRFNNIGTRAHWRLTKCRWLFKASSEPLGKAPARAYRAYFIQTWFLVTQIHGLLLICQNPCFNGRKKKTPLVKITFESCPGHGQDLSPCLDLDAGMGQHVPYQNDYAWTACTVQQSSRRTETRYTVASHKLQCARFLH